MNLEIKELRKKDFDKAIEFAIDGMNFNKYLENKYALKLYGRYFFIWKWNVLQISLQHILMINLRES